MSRSPRTDKASAACSNQMRELQAEGTPRDEAILITILTVLVAMNLSLQDIRDHLRK